jgi:hypothetical protein
MADILVALNDRPEPGPMSRIEAILRPYASARSLSPTHGARGASPIALRGKRAPGR